MTAQPGGALQGRVALVTGASRGIGRATALALAREGADLVVTATTQPHADQVANEIAALGRKALPLGGDVSHSADVERICASAMSVFKRVDVLINNAGIVHRAPLGEVSDADFDRVLGVNLAGPFYFARRLAPGMVARGWGRIVNVSSISGTLACPGNLAYAASKWGLNGLTKSLAEELKGTGVVVTGVMPGAVRTGMVEGSGLQPVMEPDHVATTIRFLCVDSPPAITGGLVELFG